MYSLYNPICEREYFRDFANDDKIKLGALITLLSIDNKLDNEIAMLLKLEDYGASNDYIPIKGLSKLIEMFKETDKDKFDIEATLEEISYIGVTHDKQIRLKFTDDIVANGHYSFTSQFLNDQFSMYKFASHCMDHNYNDIIKDNLEVLFARNKDNKYQYRMIKENGQTLIRGITSIQYKDFDNHIVLYATLLIFHKYMIDNEASYVVGDSYFTDSYMQIYLEKEKPIEIAGLGNVYPGIFIRNNEIKESQIYIEVRYRISDKNSTFHFIPRNTVVEMRHQGTLKKLKSKFEALYKIDKYFEPTMNLVSSFKNIEKLSEEIIIDLMNDIVEAKKIFASKTRSNVEKLLKDYVVDNTLSLLAIFGKVDALVFEVSEKIYLEKLFYKYLLKVSRS